MKQDKADGDSQEGEGGKGGADSGKKNRRKEASSTDDGEDGSGKWRRATATHYTSYPPCCHDPSADQIRVRGTTAGASGRARWVGSTVRRGGQANGPSRWGPRCCPPPPTVLTWRWPRLCPDPCSLRAWAKRARSGCAAMTSWGSSRPPTLRTDGCMFGLRGVRGRRVAGCLPVRCLGSHCLCRLTPPRSRAATGVEQPLERQAAAAEEPRDGRDHGGHGGLPGAGARLVSSCLARTGSHCTCPPPPPFLSAPSPASLPGDRHVRRLRLQGVLHPQRAAQRRHPHRPGVAHRQALLGRPPARRGCHPVAGDLRRRGQCLPKQLFCTLQLICITIPIDDTSNQHLV